MASQDPWLYEFAFRCAGTGEIIAEHSLSAPRSVHVMQEILDYKVTQHSTSALNQGLSSKR